MPDPSVTLKLAKTTQTESDSLLFERRRAARRVLAGHVTALQLLGDAAVGQHKKICSLQLVDISDTGLGVMSQEPVELNTPITVFFPPHGPDHGFDAVGHVVRCRQADWGHELGIRFDARLAA